MSVYHRAIISYRRYLSIYTDDMYCQHHASIKWCLPLPVPPPDRHALRVGDTFLWNESPWVILNILNQQAKALKLDAAPTTERFDLTTEGERLIPCTVTLKRNTNEHSQLHHYVHLAIFGI